MVVASRADNILYRLVKFAHMLPPNHPMCIKCQSGARPKPTTLIYQLKNAFLHKPKGPAGKDQLRRDVSRYQGLRGLQPLS